MTERVLTDAEIASIRRQHEGGLVHDICRAVEAAVLAKVGDGKCLCLLGAKPDEAWVRHNAYLAKVREQLGGRITEREARKRERVAENAAFIVGATRHGAGYEWAKQHADIAYPLPTKRVPRSVVLSGGVQVRSTGRGDTFDIVLVGSRIAWSNTPESIYAYARTPADARLLADLVERPYDEVPDDGPQVVGTL